MSSGIGVE